MMMKSTTNFWMLSMSFAKQSVNTTVDMTLN